MSEFEYVVISLTCPLCKEKTDISCLYIPKEMFAKKVKKVTAVRRCCKRCREYLELHYSLDKKSNGKFSLRVHKLICNEKECTHHCTLKG